MAYKERVRFPHPPGITLFVSDGGLLGVYSAVAVETTFWRNLWEKGFHGFPLFEETFVTPQ